MTRPLVLVTNDDGVGAVGLHAATLAVHRAGGSALVVAPSADLSVTGMALGGDFGAVPLHVEPAAMACPTPDALVYRAAAYPAALVTYAAAGAFGRRPDVVLAGINHGANTGVGVMHSSTVGAALTGGLAGIPAVAVSTAGPRDQVDWARCELFTATLLTALAAMPAQSGGAINVNLPARPPDDAARIGWRSLATTGTTRGRVERASLDGDVLALRMRYEVLTDPPPPDTDSGALLRGDATLTWIGLPHTRPPQPAWRAGLLRCLRVGWTRQLTSWPVSDG